jgi:hypothetical protein
VSYRYAIGSYGRPVGPRRRRLASGVCALAGTGSALVAARALGWEVLPPWIAALALVGAIILGALSAAGNSPAGEVYFPRSDGRWVDPSGRAVVDARYMAGNPPPGRLLLGYPGGFAAATVCEKERSGRFSAGGELHSVTLLIAAEGAQPYRTRILMRLLPGDEERFWPGSVLLAARFTGEAPDIALLPETICATLSPEERERADVAVAAGLTPREAPRLPIRDSRTYQHITSSHNVFWAFFYERPNAVWRDIATRGDWLRYLKMVGVFAAAFAATALAVLLLVVLMLLVPGLDGSGPGAYN